VKTIMSNLRERDVVRVIRSHRQLEGAGFVVRRPFPSPSIPVLDPFLLLDEAGPTEYAPGEATGAPDHPHRGFETISYVLEGDLVHEDSAGHRGELRSGDVQWMTAGGGIVHSEMPSPRMREEGGLLHAFQIWINLPAKLKMTQPRYQDVPSARIPTKTTADGKATVRIVAGEALGERAVIETHSPVVYQDWTLDDGADVTVNLEAGQTALAYVFRGSAKVGSDAKLVSDGEMAVFGDGDVVRLRGAPSGGRLLLLAAHPIGEPVARYGPFVMNTQAELQQAFADYRSGRMGEITRSARVG
jgi:redox-sensitive bicupin YhaK (pirin superfamily)